ncbi:MAG: DUF6113 family protein [Actinomycetota bacterium]|nr:DUF6113 family protein [Actinomycetota bacterium]
MTSRLAGATLAGWYVVLAALGALAGLVGAFLIPLHVGRTVAPVSIVIAVVGNVALALLGARATGSRAGAAVPWVSWLFVAIVLSSAGRGGDIVVTGDVVGYGYLLGGALGGGLALVLVRPKPPTRAQR